MTAVLRLGIGAVAVLWWLPTVALTLLDLVTFYTRARLALWAVGVLIRAGEVDRADRLLRRSREAVQRYGRARGWR